jgi:hypothetical protein
MEGAIQPLTPFFFLSPVKAERRKQVKPFAYFQLGASLFFIENKKNGEKGFTCIRVSVQLVCFPLCTAATLSHLRAAGRLKRSEFEPHTPLSEKREREIRALSEQVTIGQPKN